MHSNVISNKFEKINFWSKFQISVVKSLLGQYHGFHYRNLKFRPKIDFFKIVQNHLGMHHGHPGGVVDGIGAVF